MMGWSFTGETLSAIVISGEYCAEIMDGLATSGSFVYACSGALGPILESP